MGREGTREWSRSAEPPAIPAKARVGHRIRAFREWRGLTRSQLAGLLGLSESWLYQIEHGVQNRDRRIALPVLQEIANHVGVTVEDLVGESVVGPAAGPYRADRTVLAVLPMRCAPGGRLDDFMAAGVCDDLVTRLSKIRALLVIGPESTGPLVEARRTVVGVGHELGAHAVLTSSLAQRSADEVHLNVRLIDVRNGFTRWSDAYDLPYTQLSDVQSRVASAVAAGLQLRLTPGEADALGVRSTADVRAYEFYLRGVGLVSTNHEPDLNVGLAMFAKAVELDSGFAAAHGYLGYALWRRYFSGWDAGAEVLGSALESADRALALDSSCAVGRMARIRIYWDLGRHEQAVSEGHLVVNDNPGNLDALLALARAYNNAGMADLALPLTEQVLASDSSNLSARKLLIWNHLMVGNHQAAVETGNAYLRLHPEDANTAWAAAMAHLHLSQFDAALVTAEQGLTADRYDFTLWTLVGYIHRARGNQDAMRKSWARGAETVSSRLGAHTTNHRARAWLANLLAGAGSRDAARAIIDEIRQAEPGNAYLLYREAHVLAELGDVDQAVDALEAAIKQGFMSLQILHREEHCAFASLVTSDRYRSAVRRLEDRVDALRHRYMASA